MPIGTLPANAVFTSYPPHASAVTPSDSSNFDVASTVYVGVAGDVVVIPWYPDGASAVTFVGLPAGATIPCLVRRVNSTGTTATNMVRVF